MQVEVSFVLNQKAVRVKTLSHHTLLYVLREVLGLTGTKMGCGKGECGACTVLINKKPVNSCLVLILQVEGAEIETIEALNKDGKLHPLQQAFINEGAVQCGFCTPGMIISAKALLEQNPSPTPTEIKQAISGNLCRCTGYLKIEKAILKAAKGEV